MDYVTGKTTTICRQCHRTITEKWGKVELVKPIGRPAYSPDSLIMIPKCNECKEEK